MTAAFAMSDNDPKFCARCGHLLTAHLKDSCGHREWICPQQALVKHLLGHQIVTIAGPPMILTCPCAPPSPTGG